MPTGSCGLA